MIKEGIININKPAGMTSHDCVYAVRRLTGIKRVGHTGTLDPNATGVLPVCIGTAARIAEYTELDLKSYDCEMELGITTDTQDIWGELREDRRKEIESGAIPLSEEKIREAFLGLEGTIEQYPPKYSAVRYGGRRLYEYAREGKEIEIRPRTVYIESVTVNRVDLAHRKVCFSVVCGKGTYIRAICQEVGERLGCGAAMTALVRTGSGAFSIQQAVDLRFLKELTLRKDEPGTEAEINALILPPDYPLAAFGKAVIKTAERARWFVNGGHIRLSEVDIERQPRYQSQEAPFEIREEYKEAYAVYGYPQESTGGESEQVPLFLGVAFYNHSYKKLVADKVFRRMDEGI